MYGFIDDIITITIDNTYWVERAKNSALLVIYTIFRPLHSNKPLKRNDPFSLRKLAGEGKISERKTCMGWDIHTRSLRVFLPREKYTTWAQGIISYLSLTKINTDKLEYLIDKTNHATNIITSEMYFLN